METLKTDSIDFSKYYADTAPKRVVFEKADYAEDVATFIANPHANKGKYLPWDKNGDFVGLRDSEVSLWAGVNGHGKSLALGQVCLTLAEQGEKILICSFEMQPKRTLLRMMHQAIGGSNTNPDNQKAFWDWKKNHVYVLDHHGMIDPHTMLAICRYAVAEKGVTHIVIDSLMKCIPKETDYDAQKDFVNQVCTFAQDTNAHVHLVHHVRKGEKETSMPDKWDIKGSGSIADQVDNIFIVWRNKAKERELEERGIVDHTIPDAALICCKQRNGDWEGKIALWMHRDSQQFISLPRGLSYSYIGG